MAVAVAACAEPSPKSQSKDNLSPSASDEPAELNVTLSGGSPETGVALATATGTRLAPLERIATTRPRSSTKTRSPLGASSRSVGACSPDAKSVTLSSVPDGPSRRR